MNAQNAVEQKAAKEAKEGQTPRTEDEVVELIRERGRVGRAKYRHTMDRVDLPPEAWARNLQEELGDALQYARRAERVLRLLSWARIIMRSELEQVVTFTKKQRVDRAKRWLDEFEKEFAP